jgi:hypothetical protein
MNIKDARNKGDRIALKLATENADPVEAEDE